VAAAKLKLYLDSSVLGYSVSRFAPQRKKEANILLRQIREGRFVGGYSFVTEAEISAAPKRLAEKLRRKIASSGLRRVRVRSRSEVFDLAYLYCRQGIIPQEFLEDALHIAVATLWRADALVSYNFTHIVRLETMLGVNAINRRKNHADIFLCQPSEVIIS
jgi:hypothetical protein